VLNIAKQAIISKKIAVQTALAEQNRANLAFSCKKD